MPTTYERENTESIKALEKRVEKIEKPPCCSHLNPWEYWLSGAVTGVSLSILLYFLMN